MARSTAWGSTASLSGAGAGARAGRVVPQPTITNAIAAATDRRAIIMVCTARSSSDSLPRPSVGTLLLGCEQLPVRRVVAQRPQRREEVHHAAAWIPLRERLLYQRARGVTPAQNPVDPCPPHRVPGVQIPGAPPPQRPLQRQR